jgi:hypothetical protein
VHGLEGKEGATAFLPCIEDMAEKMDSGDVALAEFGGAGELGRTGAAALCVGSASGACVGALRVQRGERELELALK